MARCTESDQAALQEAGPLLRFAAERVKNLDPDLALYIAQAQEAAESDQWTPQISLQFWQSFAKLCDLILPATLDSLAAARETIEPSRLRKFLGAGTESLGERSSRRYLTTMIVLILLILPIQLYVWTCTNLSKKIDDLFVQERAKLSTLQQDYIRIDSDARIDAAKGGKPPTWAVDKIRVSSRSVQDNLDQIETEAHILARISLLKTPPLPLESPAPSATAAVSASSTPPGKDSEDANPSNWTAPYLDVDKRSSEMQTAVLKIQEEANLIV